MENITAAKGRVERTHLTLQDRLVKELRLRGISDVVAANAFAPEFIADCAESGAFPSDEDARRFAGEFADADWVSVESAGHTVQGDNPKGLISALNRFFRCRWPIDLSTKSS